MCKVRFEFRIKPIDGPKLHQIQRYRLEYRGTSRWARFKSWIFGWEDYQYYDLQKHCFMPHIFRSIESARELALTLKKPGVLKSFNKSQFFRCLREEQKAEERRNRTGRII